MTPEQFKSWRHDMRLSKAGAARALGIGKSSVDLYERGRRYGDERLVIIPRTVSLACAAVSLGVSDYHGPE